jgi:hypothetical protein
MIPLSTTEKLTNGVAMGEVNDANDANDENPLPLRTPGGGSFASLVSLESFLLPPDILRPLASQPQ